MRLLTGPVCIVDQTAPKTTPRPTPRDASRMREVRTQLAPAVLSCAGRVRGGGAMACHAIDGILLSSFLGSDFVCASACGRRAPQIEQQGKLGQFAAL